MSTLEAFQAACTDRPKAGQPWKERLSHLDMSVVRSIIDRIPEDWMTATARDFVEALMRSNLGRILEDRP